MDVESPVVVQKHEMHGKFAILQYIVQNELVRKALYVIVVTGIIGAIRKLVISMSKNSQKLSQTTLERFSELPSLPLIGPFYSLFMNRNDLDGLTKKWIKNHGSLWRTNVFGRDILVIHDPTLLKILLLSNDLGHLEKEPFVYDKFLPGSDRGKGLVSMPATSWGQHRKCLNTLFTYESIKRYIPIYRKYAEQLVHNLKEDTHNLNSTKAPYGSRVNLATLDIITEIITGIPFETILGHEACFKFREDLEEVMKISETRLLAKPWTLIPIVWYFHPLKKRLDKLVHGLNTAVQKIQTSLVPQPNSKFALDLMTNANWSDKEITTELITLIVTGHETVSMALIFLFWMLALEQKHQIVCQQEIDKIFDAAENTDQELTLDNFSEMKCLERCIKESLRLFPIATFGTGRELKSPLHLDKDMVLPPGTLVAYVPYILHRNPTLFPDPEKFDPDRFLYENVKNRDKFAYLPFSAGPRNCIGWKSALLEITVLTAVILRHFHLVTTDKREDIKIMGKITIYPSRLPNIIFQRRR